MLSFTFTSQNATDGYDSGSETINTNSVAESESDSSDECDLTHYLIHFLTIFGGYF